MTTDIKERLRTLSFAMGKIGADASSRLYEEAASRIEQLEGQLSAQTAVKTEQPSLIITLRQAEELVEFFGGHDCWVTVTGPLSAWKKTEPGLYAYCTEYPEDGASYLGKTEVDDDLAMHGRKGKTEQPSLSDARIADIYRRTFNGMADCVRDAPQQVPPLVIAFSRAILSAQRQDSDKDAERYRYAREYPRIMFEPWEHIARAPSEIDTVIDAAIANGAPK